MSKSQQRQPFSSIVTALLHKVTDLSPYLQLSADLEQYFQPEEGKIYQITSKLTNKVLSSEKYEKAATEIGEYLEGRKKPTFVEVIKTVTGKLMDPDPYCRLAKDFLDMKLPLELPQGPFKEEQEVSQIPHFSAPISQKPWPTIEHQQQLIKEKKHQPEQASQNRSIEPNVTSPLPFRKAATGLQAVKEQSDKVERQVSNPVFKVPDQPVQQGKSKPRNMSSSQQDRRKGSAESRNNLVPSSESSFHMDLTLKTKLTKNISNNTGRADSLVYSNATLMNSHSNPFGPQLRIRSHHSVLHKIEGSVDQEPLDKIQRAVSREMPRSERQSNTERSRSSRVKPSKENITDREQERDQTERKGTQTEILKTSWLKSELKEEPSFRRKSEVSEGGVFQTQIREYKSKIGKIRELKEQKKRKLQADLRRVNQEIQGLARKEIQVSKSNNYQSRVKISDNVEAKVKAEKLVKDLRLEKRSRHEAHLGDLTAVDKNINLYMEELMKERYKNEERLKQRKKFEIIERMKQHQMRKIEEQKKKEKNLQFLHQLKQSNTREHPASNQPPTPPLLPTTLHQTPPEEPGRRRRSPTKVSEKTEQVELSPELSRKKDYFKKIRNLKFVHKKVDLYEQSLM